MPKGKTRTRINFGYGAIYQRKTKEGKIRWYLDYRDADGNRIQRVASHATNPDEAACALREEVAREFDAAYKTRREAAKISFADFSTLYLENYSKVWKKSWRSDHSYLQAHLKPFFKGKQMTNLTQALIEKYMVFRKKEGAADSTVNRELSCLRKLFNKAIDWGYVENNPVARVQFFSERDNKIERVLMPDEEKKLLGNCSPMLRSIVITALLTGMRRGEILTLGWANVDLVQRELKLTNTKSGRSRVIPINDELLGMLRHYREQRYDSAWVFPNPRTKEPFRDIKKSFRGACERAGIDNLRFHDLRHTFASRLVQSGVDLITVKDLLGHSSVRITERYTHSNKMLKEDAVHKLSKNHTKKTRKDKTLLHSCVC